MVRRASAETSSSEELVLGSSRSERRARRRLDPPSPSPSHPRRRARRRLDPPSPSPSLPRRRARDGGSIRRRRRRRFLVRRVLRLPLANRLADSPAARSLAIFELEHLPREFRHLRSHLLGAALPLLPFPHRVETLFELRLEPPRASRRGAGARPRARLALHHHHVRVCARFQQRANRVTHHEDDQIGGESTRAEPERGFRLRRPSRAAEDARRAARGRGRRERVAQRDVDGRPVHQRDADGEYVVVSEVLEESVAADEDGVAQSQEREREHEVAAGKRVAGGRARGEHGDETGFETVSNRAVSRPLEERVRLARAPIERREDARVAIEVCRRRRDERFLRRGDARNRASARRNRAEKRRVHARPGFERSTRACAEPRSFVVVVERGGSIERLLGVGERGVHAKLRRGEEKREKIPEEERARPRRQRQPSRRAIAVRRRRRRNGFVRPEKTPRREVRFEGRSEVERVRTFEVRRRRRRAAGRRVRRPRRSRGSRRSRRGRRRRGGRALRRRRSRRGRRRGRTRRRWGRTRRRRGRTRVRRRRGSTHRRQVLKQNHGGAEPRHHLPTTRAASRRV